MTTIVNGTTGITFSDSSVQNTAGINFRNRIINGSFAIWQRGTSGAMTTSPTYVAADRWGVDQASSAAATFSQSTSVPTAVAQYSGKVQRNNASSGTNNIVIAQAFETANSYDLAGQSATLSFYAKAGANFSASGSTLNFNVFYGQGTDQSLALMRSNSWTSQTNSGSSTAITTTWTRYTYTVSVPAGTTQVGLQFYFTPVGTAGADDAFYITGVQLEKGTTASSFDFRSYGTEFDLCRRYCEVYSGTYENAIPQYLGNVDVSNRPEITLIYYPKRAAPTITVGSGTNFDWLSSANTVVTTSAYNGTSVGTGTNGAILFFSTASGVTAGTLSATGCISFRSTANSVTISAEL